MKYTTLRGAIAIAALTGALAAPVMAQDSTNVIATEGDWTVFGGDNPKTCWAVSPPKKTVNTKDGKEVEVRRGDIRLYVAYTAGSSGEVSFQGGYPFAPDSAVEVNIGGNVFKLFTEGENAWTGSPADDAKLIGALRAGSEAVVTGRSSRGTVTKDTFSLAGITAMTNTAQASCK